MRKTKSIIATAAGCTALLALAVPVYAQTIVPTVTNGSMVTPSMAGAPAAYSTAAPGLTTAVSVPVTEPTTLGGSVGLPSSTMTNLARPSISMPANFVAPGAVAPTVAKTMNEGDIGKDGKPIHYSMAPPDPNKGTGDLSDVDLPQRTFNNVAKPGESE